MDLFFTLLITAIRSFFGDRSANVWDGTAYRFTPKLWDRDWRGQLFTSRIPSYIDISLVKFFVETRMSDPVRKNGWIPIVISSIQTRSQPRIPRGPLQIHTRVMGWEDQYVEMWHTWSDANGDEVLRSIYLTRVTHSGRNKVTGADMLAALGEDIVERPLSAAAQKQLEEYFRIRDANKASRNSSGKPPKSLKLQQQP